jgi:hypothetical protein
MKNEGEKFGFSFDGILYPPQNPTQSTWVHLYIKLVMGV